MIYPKLKKNATIGIVAPSSPTKENRIEKGVKKLESLGYKVVLGEACGKSHMGYLCGEDDLRIKTINEMFEREDIDAIICQNGGYGTPRLVDKIDYEIIKKNPKVFVGFSDITLLLNAIINECGFATYHGPMLTVDFASKQQDVSINTFLKLATSSENITINNDNHDMITINPGKTEGELVGGNLSLVDVLVSSKYCFDPKGKILLLEDVGEKNYRLDRMIQKLRLAGVLDELKGIIIGGITGEQTPQEGSLELFKELLKEYNYPILFNAPIGHVTPRYTCLIGGKVKLDADNKTIEIINE